MIISSNACRPNAVRVLAATLLFTAASSALATPTRFTFESAEFMPLEQREPAARAFFAQNISVGMPVQAATQVVRKAGAFCRLPSAQGGAISCTHSSFEHRPGMSLDEITWKIQITPAADGTVAAASVSRTKAGL
ncbi:hypothetical protein [Caulobacter sp. S45]|uniref:hypothetical protein n=1 Tax=Caulobacter sp. S45 TaxID=1641861 RepID=UPI00131AE98D|nr:hypothetical protein [Caulobacter sp. S45]